MCFRQEIRLPAQLAVVGARAGTGVRWRRGRRRRGRPSAWLVVVGMRVDVIALHAGGGVLRSGAGLVVFRLVGTAPLRRRGCVDGAGGGVGVPRSRLVSVGVRVDVVVPRSDGGGLRSGVVFVCRRLRHRTLRRIPALLRRRRRAVGWADVLLDAIGVGWKAPNALWDGCPGTMTGVSQHWCSRHFDRCSSTPMLYLASPSASTCGANRAS